MHISLYKPFNFSFCERMVWLAQSGLESDGLHENFIVMVPDRSSVAVSFCNDGLHVVCKNSFWNAHILECMKHSDEQIFLLCVWKEFNEPLSAMMANHGKAGCLDYFAVLCKNINKSPVHLIALSRFC